MNWAPLSYSKIKLDFFLYLHLWSAAFRVCVFMTNTDVVHHCLWCLQAWIWQCAWKCHRWYKWDSKNKTKHPGILLSFQMPYAGILLFILIFLLIQQKKASWSCLLACYLSCQLTKCLHLPQNDAECPNVSLEAVVVVLEVLGWVPAQWHSLL